MWYDVFAVEQGGCNRWLWVWGVLIRDVDNLMALKVMSNKACVEKR